MWADALLPVTLPRTPLLRATAAEIGSAGPPARFGVAAMAFVGKGDISGIGCLATWSFTRIFSRTSGPLALAGALLCRWTPIAPHGEVSCCCSLLASGTQSAVSFRTAFFVFAQVVASVGNPGGARQGFKGLAPAAGALGMASILPPFFPLYPFAPL